MLLNSPPSPPCGPACQMVGCTRPPAAHGHRRTSAAVARHAANQQSGAGGGSVHTVAAASASCRPSRVAFRDSWLGGVRAGPLPATLPNAFKPHTVRHVHLRAGWAEEPHAADGATTPSPSRPPAGAWPSRMERRTPRLAVVLVLICATAAQLPAGAAAASAEASATPKHHGGQPWRPRTYVSPLWGRYGELWTPAGRLADWSDAGYSGEGRPIPWYPAPRSFCIDRFGARPTPGFGAQRRRGP